MKEVLVIVPAFNESENLRKVEEELKTDFPEADILFINDHSTDNTLEIIKSFDDVHYLNLPVNLGYFFAIQSGLKYAAQKGYDYVVQFDGDGQHIAREAKRLYEYSKQSEADIVIGSRYLEEKGYVNSFFRSVGTKFIKGFAKMLTGRNLSDPTSGMQVLKKNVVRHLAQIYNYPETADANLLMELVYQGFSIDELAVEMRNREMGGSMHAGIIGPAKYMTKMVYYMTLVYLNNLLEGKKVQKDV